MNKRLDEMSVEEIQEFRAKYVALTTAAPMAIEHVLADDEPEQLPLLADEATSPTDNDVSVEAETPAPPRPRGRPRKPSPSLDHVRDQLMLAEITLDHVEIPDGRRAVDPDAVARLKNSIAVVGLQHPITVAKRDGGYRLLAGAHRLTAFRELGMERISANVVELDDVHAGARRTGRKSRPQ